MHDNRWEGEKEPEKEKEKEDKTKREEKAKKKEVVKDAEPPTTDKVRFFICIINCLNLLLFFNN